MAAQCEDELICDMAETYHVLNWRELPLKTAAILASGLHPDSRTCRKLSGQKVILDTAIRAAMLDELRMLVWMNTKDGSKGKNRPESIFLKMLAPPEKPKMTVFSSPEAFEQRRNQILAGG